MVLSVSSKVAISCSIFRSSFCVKSITKTVKSSDALFRISHHFVQKSALLRPRVGIFCMRRPWGIRWARTYSLRVEPWSWYLILFCCRVFICFIRSSVDSGAVLSVALLGHRIASISCWVKECVWARSSVKSRISWKLDIFKPLDLWCRKLKRQLID